MAAMDWTEGLTIETPEQIDVELELAGLGSRFVARVLDWLIKAGILILLLLAVAVGLAIWESLQGSNRFPPTGQWILGSVAFAFLFGFDIYYETRHQGQTLGKKIAGIRVVRRSGAPIDGRAAVIRNLLAIADFLPAFYLFGSLLVQWTARRQRLGDLAADTIVIRERTLEAPAEVDALVERFALPTLTFTAEQLAGCGTEGRAILRSFFQRYATLAESPRRQLTTRLAEQFLRRSGYPLAQPWSDEPDAVAFLASLYRDLERLARHGR